MTHPDLEHSRYCCECTVSTHVHSNDVVPRQVDAAMALISDFGRTLDALVAPSSGCVEFAL